MSHQERPRRTFAAGALASLALAVATAVPLPTLAQNRPGGGGNENGGPAGTGPGGAPVFVGRGGGFGRVDPLAGVKTQINASDEEWKVIGPKLRAVAAAQQVVEADPTESLGMTDVRRGGPGGGGNGAFAGPAGAGGQRGGPGGRGGGGPGGADPGGNRPDGDRGGPPGERRPGGPDGIQGRQNLGGAFIAGPGGPGGGPGGNPFRRSSPVSLAQADLKTALDNPQSSPQEIQEKVLAVRAAVQKARADLAAARKDLVELLTADQQLVLVGLGYLE